MMTFWKKSYSKSAERTVIKQTQRKTRLFKSISFNMIVAGKIDYIPVEYHWLLLRQVMRKINQASDNVKGNLIQTAN